MYDLRQDQPAIQLGFHGKITPEAVILTPSGHYLCTRKAFADPLDVTVSRRGAESAEIMKSFFRLGELCASARNFPANALQINASARKLVYGAK